MQGKRRTISVEEAKVRVEAYVEKSREYVDTFFAADKRYHANYGMLRSAYLRAARRNAVRFFVEESIDSLPAPMTAWFDRVDAERAKRRAARRNIS